MITTKKVRSFAISEMKYNDKAKTLTIAFKSGSSYRYRGVGIGTFRAFTHADSKGGFFHRNIRGKYDFQKVA